MIYILIDTNIFYEKKFDVDHKLFQTLSEFASSKEITVLTNSILRNEYASNIDKMIEASQKYIIEAFKKNDSLLYKYKVSNGEGKKAIRKYFGEYWNLNVKKPFFDFLDQMNGIDIGLSNDVEQVFEAYFDNTPPFEDNKTKKNEFPDAFLSLSLAKWKNHFDLNYDDEVYLVSQDKGIKECCKNLEISTFSSLSKLFNYINHLSELEDVDYSSLDGIITKFLENYVSEEDINIDNFENDEEVSSFSILSVDIVDTDVLNREYKEDKIVIDLNISAEVDLSVLYEYIDYSKSPYDSEIKDYLWLAIEKKSLRATTTLEFLVTIEIEQISSDLSIEDADYSIEPSFSQINLFSDEYPEYY